MLTEAVGLLHPSLSSAVRLGSRTSTLDDNPDKRRILVFAVQCVVPALLKMRGPKEGVQHSINVDRHQVVKSQLKAHC
jgi:hypothetical protein